MNPVALSELSDVVLHLSDFAEQLQWIKLCRHLSETQFRLLGDHRRVQQSLGRRLRVVVALLDPGADANLLFDLEGGLEEVYEQPCRA